jgi:hypothetical protein
MAEPTSASNHVSVPELPSPPVGKLPTRAERVHAARGKFAWIPFSSDDHIREKERERPCDSR